MSTDVTQNSSEKDTETIDGLAKSGLKIDGFYTYKVCAPARAAFLTGRFPFHLAATKTNFAYFWTLEGTNLTYTMFPEKLQAAGCECSNGLSVCTTTILPPDADRCCRQTRPTWLASGIRASTPRSTCPRHAASTRTSDS